MTWVDPFRNSACPSRASPALLPAGLSTVATSAQDSMVRGAQEKWRSQQHLHLLGAPGENAAGEGPSRVTGVFW